MQPITSYLDYRKYILDFYTEHKERSRFSWRDFARLAGFSNPVYLKQVADGKYNLSKNSTSRVGKGMNLTGESLIYFRLLVLFCHADTDKERTSLFKKMQAIGRKSKDSIYNKDSLKFFLSWKNAVIRELATSMQDASPADIARMTIPESSTDEVNEAISLMFNLGLLQQDKNGKYHQTSKVISMMDPAKQVASTKLQIAMGKLALEALKDIPFSNRSMTGLTIGISSKSYKRIVFELAEFRKKIIAIVTDDPVTEQVYRLNLQFFPLSKKIEKVSSP